MKTKKWFGILLLGVVTLGGCASQSAQKDVIIELQESALNAPQTTVVTRGDIQVVTYYDAQVGPKVEQLSFAEADSFGEFLVELGDTVQEGDILATPALENLEEQIENKEQEIEAYIVNYNYNKTSLENSLEIAKLNLEKNLKALESIELYSAEYTATCVAAGNYDEQRQKLELQLKQLKETYDMELPYLKKQLAKLKKEYEGNLIKAPFDGTIIALAEAEYGQYIDPKAYYVAVADNSLEYARCLNVSITVLKNLEKITFWKDGKEYEATNIPMTHAYYMATQNNGENAYSEFEINDPNGEVSIGDYGKVKLVLEEKEDVLLLPEAALILSGGNYYVYKDVEGKHEKVPVKVGYKDGLKAEIEEGLEEGDVVYVQE